MFKEVITLNPVHFFSFRFNCLYCRKQALEKHHLLPDTSSFFASMHFADVALGWSEEGLKGDIFFHIPLAYSVFPDIQSGDSIELFIDTRDIKTNHSMTRFCHHFYFLPSAVETNGETIQAGEITRFQTEDAHELCDPGLLSIQTEKKKNGARIRIEIPSRCLHGYDPVQCGRIGLAYRINRFRGAPQFFTCTSADVSIEQHPSLWASLHLTKGTHNEKIH